MRIQLLLGFFFPGKQLFSLRCYFFPLTLAMGMLCYKYAPWSPCLAQIGFLKPWAAWVSKTNWSHKMESMSGWRVPVAVSAPAVCSNASFYCVPTHCRRLASVESSSQSWDTMNLPCSSAQQPQTPALLLLYGWQQLHDFCSALYIQTSTDLQAHGLVFFFVSHKYVLIKQSLVLLNIAVTFVSCLSLWLDKALAKASLKCISGCAKRDVSSVLLARCAGAPRQKKETIISHCQSNSFCLFLSESIRAKSPNHWSQGKDSSCFTQLWIKATVQRHSFSVG